MRNNSTLAYTIDEVAQILHISTATAKVFCTNSPDIHLFKMGKLTLINKASFDTWLQDTDVYLVSEIAKLLDVNKRNVYTYIHNKPEFRVLNIESCLRIPKSSFDAWTGIDRYGDQRALYDNY